MDAGTIDQLRNIDDIENAKADYFRVTGNHLSIKLRRDRVDMSITPHALRPVMLPITKRLAIDQLREYLQPSTIKVRKG